MGGKMDYKKLSFSTNIIEHLGKNLITAPEVAFVELIKNSLDASINSMEKKVQISYFESIDILKKKGMLLDVDYEILSFVPLEYRKKPFFVVEDFGAGMDEEMLQKGFLCIGTNVKTKRNFNNDKIVLGDKGIGRLATQRLGNCLLVETASEKEAFSNIISIEWTKLSERETINDVNVPYMRGIKQRSSYTRLWIFDVNENDLIRPQGQLSLFADQPDIRLNENLDNAVCFLISPFSENNKDLLRFFYNGIPLKYGFDQKMLQLAETIHQFEINVDDKDNLSVELNLLLSPHVIQRIHRSRINPTSEFVKYERTQEEYEKLLEKYKIRFEKTFHIIIDEKDFVEMLVKEEKNSYTESSVDDGIVTNYLTKEIEKQTNEIKCILPITGKIYSYRKDTAWCKTAIKYGKFEKIDAKQLQQFMSEFNGIKLYRKSYRIGFLGNKDSDWLKLQQYRTQGHQFSRFNLGTTLGEVVINDPHQKYIKEISSRLDINHDKIANFFLKVVEKICNGYFYYFNEALTEMIREILSDEGMLQESITKQIKREANKSRELLVQNRELKKKLKCAKELLKNITSAVDGTVTINENSYQATVNVLDLSTKNLEETEAFIKDSAMSWENARSRLEQIEIEAFNNYKLMANGLITETITHELHSVVSSNSIASVEGYFDKLTDYLLENDSDLYDNCLLPINDSYQNVTEKINDVANLYKFLEKTFIRNNSKEEYAVISLRNTVSEVENRLLKDINKQHINILFKNDDLQWLLPKGVMLHVVYNLVTNSLYWINVRRRRKGQERKTEDYVQFETAGLDTLIISDTGTGVKTDMEEILFQPLQSGKGPSGRGMGLYIVKKILESFHASIILLHERNEYGNRYKFMITVPEECIRG